MRRQQNTDNPLCGGSRTQLTLCVAVPFRPRPATRLPLSALCRRALWPGPALGCRLAPSLRYTQLLFHSHSLLTNNNVFGGFFRTCQDHLDRRLAVSTLLESTVGRTRQSSHYWSLLWEGHGSLRSIWVYCGKDTAVSTLLGSTAERTCWKDTAVSTVGRLQYCGDFYVHPPVDRTGHNALGLFQVAGITCIQSHAVIVSESHTEY